LQSHDTGASQLVFIIAIFYRSKLSISKYYYSNRVYFRLNETPNLPSVTNNIIFLHFLHGNVINGWC